MTIRGGSQDYVSDHGYLTNNTVERFHGLAILYRSKQTELGYVHYMCKTNMAICPRQALYYVFTQSDVYCTLQSLSPIWKVFALKCMGVDIPHDEVESITKDWNKSCTTRSTKEHLKKRYIHHSTCIRKYVTLSGLGNVVEEYIGDGKGETENEAQTSYWDEFLDVVKHEVDDEIANDNSNFTYDCETTGISIYKDHIIEIAARLYTARTPIALRGYQ